MAPPAAVWPSIAEHLGFLQQQIQKTQQTIRQHLGERGDIPQKKETRLKGETKRKRLGIPVCNADVEEPQQLASSRVCCLLENLREDMAGCAFASIKSLESHREASWCLLGVYDGTAQLGKRYPPWNR